jgi:hypothetical protein
VQTIELSRVFRQRPMGIRGEFASLCKQLCECGVLSSSFLGLQRQKALRKCQGFPTRRAGRGVLLILIEAFGWRADHCSAHNIHLSGQVPLYENARGIFAFPPRRRFDCPCGPWFPRARRSTEPPIPAQEGCLRHLDQADGSTASHHLDRNLRLGLHGSRM